MAEQPVTVRPGTVVAVESALAVNVDGAVLTAVWWPAGYSPAAGDTVRVIVTAGEATVLGPSTSSPRPTTATVTVSAVGGVIPIVGSDGVDYRARYIGTAPSSGSLVLLSWQSTTPWVLSTAAAVSGTSPTPPPSGPSGPPVATSGTLILAAIDSGYRTNQWFGGELRQGSYGGRTYTGAWFYGSAPAQLAGATITGCRLRVGARLRIGSYNASIDLQVYRCLDGSRPGGDTTRSGGPQAITWGPGSDAGWVGLSAGLGQDLVNAGSGGIAIAGGSYGGVQGIDTDPASGQLALDWTR